MAVTSETTGPWAVDTIAPVSPLTEAYYGFTRENNEWVLYPLFHYIVLDIAFSPYIAFQYLKGNLKNLSNTFPYGVSDPVVFFKDLTRIARIMSLFMAIGILLTLYKITKELFSVDAALWSTLMGSLLAPLAYYATTSNLDVPYTFWTLLAVWQYILIIKKQQLIHYIGFAIFVATAVATKDQAYGFFVFTPILLAYAIASHRNNGYANIKQFISSLVSAPIILSGLIALFVFALANNLLFGGFNGFLRHLDFLQTYHNEHILLVVPDLYSFWRQISLLTDSFEILVWTLGFGSLSLCAVGIIYTLMHRNWLALSLALFIMTYYIFTLAPAGTIFPRHFLAPVLLLLPFGGTAITNLLAHQNVIRNLSFILVIISLSWQVLLSINLNYILLNDSRYEMQSWIRENIPEGSTIESQINPKYLPHIADNYNIVAVGNAFNAIDYSTVPDALHKDALLNRAPDYILILKNVRLTGDPDRVENPLVQEYYEDLLNEKLGYKILVTFITPSLLPYRPINGGILPTSILLGRADQLAQQ